MPKKTNAKHGERCKCPNCGVLERIRRVGKTITTNLCHALGGICGGCLMKEAS